MADRTFNTVNPYTEQVLATYTVGNTTDILKDIERADEAFRKDWKPLNVTERAAYLTRAADLMEKQKSELAELAAREMGKPVKQGEGEVGLLIYTICSIRAAIHVQCFGRN